ncbi:hypothetical protein [Rubritalea tangerina]|uniref:DUF1559 domain-containing protein n=1 Tax=Rubritalea tangerina TaxID=430798 RepID=A0ABW4ZBQ6_9BACT
MKTQNIYLLPTISLVALSPLMAQDNGVDTKAANFKEGKFTDYLELAEKAIEANADDLPEDVKAQDLFNALGLGNISKYAQSSTPQGTEWINKIHLNNGGDNQGALKLLLDTKHKGLSVPNMAPAGSDLALQLSLNLSNLEPLVSSVMAKAATDEDKADFKAQMESPVPMMEMTTSELLQKLDLRLNLVIDLDENEKLPTPVGEFNKPHIVGRIDGAAWTWAKVGAQAIGGTGLPFQKAEANGVTTYTLPAEMSANFMGYSPVISVDKNKDQIWVASSPEFLKKSSSGQNTLAQSEDYKKTMEGLPKDGVSMTYVSKGFANFLFNALGELKTKGMLDEAGDEANEQIDLALAQLNKVQTGMAQVISTDANGILLSERNVKNIEEQMKEGLKLLETK